MAELKRIMDFQLFTGDGDGIEDEDGKGGTETDPKDEPLSFDDFLKENKEAQSEFDRRVNKAIETAVSNAKEKWEVSTNDKLTEAERLAKMTKEEKANYRADQLQKQVDAFKHEKAVAELKGEARKLLSDDGINAPEAVLDGLVREDAEKTKEAVEDFKSMVNEMVNKIVKEKARNITPKTGVSGNSGSSAKSFGEMAKEARIIR